jgi:hypothetical protein
MNFLRSSLVFLGFASIHTSRLQKLRFKLNAVMRPIALELLPHLRTGRAPDVENLRVRVSVRTVRERPMKEFRASPVGAPPRIDAPLATVPDLVPRNPPLAFAERTNGIV